VKILVTGGAGYIGSHTVVELLDNNYEVVIVDNLCNSKEESLHRIKRITKKDFTFEKIDLLNGAALDRFFQQNKFEAVIHFAGLKAVGESVKLPLKYYENNVTATIQLCQLMQKYNIKNLVFSSSATVYGDPQQVPIKEDFPRSATNPYGRTKLIIEDILQDLYRSDQEWNIILLRYFNPIGAHPSGLIGEDPNGIPNNLMPYISQVAIGKLPELSIYGNDYPTPDGTGIRDYIHVVDLAKGHVCALQKLKDKSGLQVFNLGTGQGYSVLDIVKAFKKATGVDIPYKIVGRRPGDIARCYADAGKAARILKWQAKFGLEQMCKHAWNWQKKNPKGYDHPNERN